MIMKADRPISLDRRGMSILLLVLLILFFVAFYAFQHIYTAQTRTKQAHKMFQVNDAMNLAEAAIQLAILNVNTEMNDPNANKDKNYWYANFRQTIAGGGSVSKDLRALAEVTNLADKFKGKVKELTVSLEAIDRFYDAGGNPESFKDIEKCGAVQYNCVAEIMGTGARIRARQEFKVVQVRHPYLNNYVLFVKDAWGEYSSKNNIGYPSFSPQNYKTEPGSQEGFNPSDHNLTVKSRPEANMDPGKILMGGPMDSDKKIIVSLSDEDTDMMDEVWPNAGSSNSISGGNGVTTNPKIPNDELKQIYYSLAHDPDKADDTKFNTDWNDLITKTQFWFFKKNCGFSSEYIYGYKKKFSDSGTLKTTPVLAQKGPPPNIPSLDNVTTVEAFNDIMNQLMGIHWYFGSPAMTYIGAMRELGASITPPADPKFNITHVAYNDKKAATDAKGLDLFGQKGSRQFTVVEGNVWQRYTNLSVLAMEVTAAPGDPSKIYNFRFAIPAMLTTWHQEYGNAAAVPKDQLAFNAFIESQYANKKATKNIFINGIAARARNADTNSPTKINYNSEVVVRPYNMGHDNLRKTPINLEQDDMKKVLVEPAKGYDEMSPVMSAKASVIYEDEVEFFEKCSVNATIDGANVRLINLHGNVIIKSDLHFVGQPVVYKGSGVVMVVPDTTTNPPHPRSIFIGTRIAKLDPAAIMTLYPTWGTINIMADNLEINASLMALHPFYNPSNNLLSFIAGPNQSGLSANTLKIKGNVCVDRLNLPAFPKNTTIEYDQHFKEMGTEDDFFVSLSSKFNYWVKEPL